MSNWDEVIALLQKSQVLLEKASDYWQEAEEQMMVARIKLGVLKNGCGISSELKESNQNDDKES